ncbi:UNVERIFIED_ORG: hypothetical protein J2806_000631 [Kosakonia oryzae]|uniref:Uncharacterized protein n=1 Tax=Kosakonia radicincitans TaxID=283686 RepID=A0AAX2ELN9_9ENTR|nr:hypothetical protein [Kosakonia oryzae]SFD91836.1 hypothetical protein SAMN03159468_00376 [Kosakonia radicincitans]SFQ97336.1 hypothetical protein SAMN03159514_00375 [Kosakonia radicincitans]SFT39819.1 hypothetical protein SAMN03159428_00374 [Kosakonia radicincitans]SFX09043.1 hypothetical protein SAMN03159436_00374 [Kosakonia radicincitans]
MEDDGGLKTKQGACMSLFIASRITYPLLHPFFYLTFKPSGGSTHFYWLWKITFAYQAVKPFIGQTGKGGNKFHVDHLVIKQGCIFRYHDEFSPGNIKGEHYAESHYARWYCSSDICLP